MFIFKDHILAFLQSQIESNAYNVHMGYAGIPFEYKAINLATGEHLSEGIDIIFPYNVEVKIEFIHDSHLIVVQYMELLLTLYT